VAIQEPKFIFSLLDSSLHDREAFLCGESLLDNYLKRQASQDIKRGISRVHVMTPENDPKIIAGYYTLSSSSIVLTDLPEHLRKGLPSHFPIGVTLLGRLAIDNRFQGQGLGEILFFDALYKTLIVSEQSVASLAVIIDALHNKAKAFYLRYKAIEFADKPLKLVMPMKTIKELCKEVGLWTEE
jgi:predicted GNAT family N-acyltransferase